MIVKLINLYKNFLEVKYKKIVLKKIPEIKDILKKTNSTGISFQDIFYLYSDIIKIKPKTVLECGAGVSTVVISLALEENFKKNKIKAKIISIEDKKKYFLNLKKIFPKRLKKFTKIIIRDSIEKNYLFYTGRGYKNIPKLNYDYIFIDGPNSYSNVLKTKMFNFDLLEILKFSKSNINGLIDERISTVKVYQDIFKDKVKYNFLTNFSFIRNINKSHLPFPHKGVDKVFAFRFKRRYLKNNFTIN